MFQQNVHHKPIKKFGLDGVINDESNIARLKIEYVRLLLLEMRLSGYVPRLDIDPDFTIRYNEQKNYFEFKLSIHGVYIGKRRIECIVGIDGTTVVSTQPNRLTEFYLGQASQSNLK
jgi:hypothetical protein